MPKVTLKITNQPEPVAVEARLEDDRFEVSLGDQNYQGHIHFSGPGEGWLTLEARTLPFFLTRKQDALSIWLDGKTYHLDRLNPGNRSGGAGGNTALSGGDVKAPMPGTVLKVLVQAGDTVAANQPLLIMESMKMEMTLSAPQAATVESVHGTEGQLVDMGVVLIKLKVQSD